MRNTDRTLRLLLTPVRPNIISIMILVLVVVVLATSPATVVKAVAQISITIKLRPQVVFTIVILMLELEMMWFSLDKAVTPLKAVQAMTLLMVVPRATFWQH